MTWTCPLGFSGRGTGMGTRYRKLIQHGGGDVDVGRQIDSSSFARGSYLISAGSYLVIGRVLDNKPAFALFVHQVSISYLSTVHDA
jgi:hypothetical protein